METKHTLKLPLSMSEATDTPHSPGSEISRDF